MGAEGEKEAKQGGINMSSFDAPCHVLTMYMMMVCVCVCVCVYKSDEYLL